MKTSHRMEAVKADFISRIAGITTRKSFFVKLFFLSFILLTTTKGYAQTISPWKMNRGAGVISYSISTHGDPAAFSQMNIPVTSDANWTDAPVNANGEINFSETSIIPNVSGNCLNKLDFTYFQTFISIPVGFNVNDLNVSFSAADDGARAYIFNSDHPNGAFIGEIGLGGAGTSTNYASLSKAGEINRLVIVQFDSCPTGNNLTGAKVNINGQAAPINTGGCTQSNFFWSNPPALVNPTASTDPWTAGLSSSTSATGTINGIGYTYESNTPFDLTADVFMVGSRFPASYGIPNQASVRNIRQSENRLVFDSPMTNPVLVFSSIGGAVPVSIQFDQDIDVLYQQVFDAGAYVTVDDANDIVTGKEAYVIVRFNGSFSELTFDYLDDEFYVNFAFGADFSTNFPDTVAPILTLNGSATETVTIGDTFTDAGATITDNCDTNPASLVSGTVDTNVLGTYTLTYTGVDASGNTSNTLTRTVTVVGVAPVITTTDITVSNDAGVCGAIVNYAAVQITVGIPAANIVYSIAPGSNFGVGTVAVTATATNSVGTSSSTFNVTVEDNEAPTMTVQNTNVQLDHLGQGSIQVSDVLTATNDNCTVAGTSVSQLNFDCTDVGTNTVTVSVTDTNGNVTSQNVTVTVLDVQPIVAGDDEFTLETCGPINFTAADLLGNDSDPYSQSLIVEFVNQPNSGTITDNGNGNFTYTPGSNIDHTATATYLVKRDDGTVVFSENGHFYEFVSSPGISWTAAKAAAEARTHQGRQGYLVTITSQEENDFAFSKINAQGWIGATDAAQEGTWIWDGGPEAGQQFWSGLANGGPVNGAYNAWGGGEPNNAGNEDYAHFRTDAKWNDFPLSVGSIQGYIVEYGGTATDCNIESTTTGTINFILDDNTAPIASTTDLIVQLDASGNATITANQINNNSSDDCGIASIALDRTTFDCSDVGAEQPAEYALQLDGQNDFVNMGDFGGVLNNATQASYQVWVKVLSTNSAYSYSSIIEANNGVDKYLSMEMHTYASGYGKLGVWVSGGALHTTNSVINLNEWVNLTAVYDGTQAVATDRVKIYVNGVNQTLSGGGIPASTLGDIEDVIIGSQRGEIQFSNTIYDEARVWDYALSAAEVQANWNQTIVGNEAGLLGYYSFEDGPGSSTVTELTGNQGLATLNNMDANTAWVGGADGLSTGAAGVEVTLTVTDVNGNVSTETATVTVEDNIAPAITAPADIDLNATSAAGAIVNYAPPVGTDNCAVTTALTAGLANGATFPIGTTVVTYTATDGSGNAASASFNVNVTGLPPEIVVPANITVDTDAGACGAVVNFAATETTAIPESMITYDIQPGSFFALGTTTVTATATNPVGSSTKTFTVTVVDNTAPVVLTKNIDIYLDANGWAGIGSDMIDNGSNDACGLESYHIDKFDFYCGDVGANTVTLTVTDNNGNVSSATSIVTVHDNIAPVVLTKNIDIYLDANGWAGIGSDMIDNGSNDACGLESYHIDKFDFYCGDVGANTVTLTVTDNNGNVSSATSIVTVHDNIAPVVLTKNIDIYLDANGWAGIGSDMIDNGSNDACGLESYHIDKFDFYCGDVGANTVTLTVTDNNGNVSSATSIVTVHDNIAPTVITKNITVALDGDGIATITPTAVDDGSFDNCSFTLSLDNSSFDCTTLGENTVMLTATDASNNSTSLAATVTVIDNAAPTIVTNPITVELDENGSASIVSSQVDGGTTDNCGVSSVTIDITSFDCSNLGDNIVTITATDVNGNVSSAPVVVSVVDVIAPVVGTQNISVDLDANGNASITPEEVLILSADDIETDENCTVSAAENHAVWLSQYVQAGYGKNKGSYKGKGKKKGHYNKPANTRFVFDNNGGGITRNTDGTATVSGTMVNTTNPEDRWIVSLSLENARNWEEWSSLGRSYKDEQGLAGNKYQKWTYYEMSPVSKLIGAGDNAGEEIALSHAPTDYRYGFQLGEAANSKNANFGMSGWFFYRNRSGKMVQGDFNLDIANCESEAPPAEAVITSDNCSIASTSLDVSSFSCGDLGENIVNVTVTDGSGNATTVPVTVTVNDPMGPTAVAQDITVSLGADGTVVVDPSLLDGGSTDNCGIVSWSLDRDSFDCGDIQKSYYCNGRDRGHKGHRGKGRSHKYGYSRGHKVTLTVTDAAGHTDSATAYVTVVDDVAPVISSEPITLVVYGRKKAYLTRRDVAQAVTDNCGVRYISFSRSRYDRRDAGENTVMVSAVDKSGNKSIGEVTVNVIDISQYGKYVTMCYKGRTRRVRYNQVQHYLRKGAVLGTCNSGISEVASDEPKEIEILEDAPSFTTSLSLSSYPNPTAGYTVFSFSSNVSGPARLAIMNTNGVQLATLFNDELEANEEVEVGYEAGALPSGIYIVRLVTGGTIKNVKLMVRK